jgi:hypothetical protein
VRLDLAVVRLDQTQHPFDPFVYVHSTIITAVINAETRP